MGASYCTFSFRKTISKSPNGTTRGGRTPNTAASAAAPNAVIHLRREYLIIGDPMWLDAWGGRTPDTAASKIFTENGETKVGTTRRPLFHPNGQVRRGPREIE